MQAKLDDVVLWVADPLRTLDFFVNLVGLTPVRAEEFRAGKAPFPSVRVSDSCRRVGHDDDFVRDVRVGAGSILLSRS